VLLSLKCARYKERRPVGAFSITTNRYEGVSSTKPRYFLYKTLCHLNVIFVKKNEKTLSKIPIWVIP
jgi:hypothetical protein